MKSKRTPAAPLMPHERFAHMMRALLGHMQRLDGVDASSLPMLDKATTIEISDALRRLRAIGDERRMRDALPNRRESASELKDAANVQALVDIYGVKVEDAVATIAGSRPLDTAVRTHHNRMKKVLMYGTEFDFRKVAAMFASIPKKKGGGEK